MVYTRDLLIGRATHYTLYEQLGLSADVVSCVTDARDARYVTHDVATLLRQRLYQIAAGYEDVNDANRLRHDPAFQAVAGDGRAALGSQPTLSRLDALSEGRQSLRRLDQAAGAADAQREARPAVRVAWGSQEERP